MPCCSVVRSSHRIPGVFIAEYERGDIGRDLFHVVCNMGLEGIVSKRRDRAYTPGKCEHWMKTRNPAHPAYSRVKDQLLVCPENLAPSPKRKVGGD